MVKKSKYPRLVRSSITKMYENNTVFHIEDCVREEQWEAAQTLLSAHVDHEGDATPAVRVYKSSPGSMTLQIRTYGPVGRNGTGKPRKVYSQFSSSRKHLLAVAAEIIRIAKNVEDV